MSSQPSVRSGHLALLILIFLLGAALRLQALALTQIPDPLSGDALQYYFNGLNLARWGVFSHAPPAATAPLPDAYLPPLLPALISPLVSLPPTEAMLFRINSIQVVLGAVSILLAYLLFAAFSNPWVALAAALLTAISPHLVIMSTYLLTETLFTLLLLMGLVALAWGFRLGRVSLAILAGLLLGLSAMARSTTEYLPLMLLPCLWIFCDRASFRRIALPSILGALAVIASWKLRGLLFVPHPEVPSLLVKTILHGMYPDFMFNDIPASRGYPYRFDPFAAQVTTLAAVLSELMQRAAQAPWRYLDWYLIGKPSTLLSWTMLESIGDIYIYPVSASPYFNKPLFQVTHLAMQALHGPLTIAALLGCLATVIRPAWLGLAGQARLCARLIVIAIGYFVLLHIIGAPYPRYGIPLRPLIYGFGVFSLIAVSTPLLGRLRRDGGSGAPRQAIVNEEPK